MDLGWNEFSIGFALREEQREREGQLFMGKQAAQCFPIAEKKVKKKKGEGFSSAGFGFVSELASLGAGRAWP